MNNSGPQCCGDISPEATRSSVKEGDSESCEQLEECGKILEKKMRSGWFASPEGQLP